MSALPRHRLDVPAPETLPFAIGTFDTIGPLAQANFPHRHYFHEIVYLTAGTGAHVVDFTARTLRPPHLCVVYPGQVHYWEGATGLRGRVILFTDEFLLAHPADRDALQVLGDRPLRQLGATESAGFNVLTAEMDREHRRRAEGFITVLQSLLHVLIVRARRAGDEPTITATGRSACVAQQFIRLLAQPADGPRSVRAYANRVGVSVSYLNEVVKEVTGRTPGQMIRQAQVLEAKRLLALTSLTVAQISRELDFGDAAYFCRFFRRETGTSPGDFRRDTLGSKG